MQNQAFRYNLFLFFKIKKVFSLQSLTHFNMKRNTVLIFVIVLMFSACNFNSKSNKKLSKEEKLALLDTINAKKERRKARRDSSNLFSNKDSIMKFPTVLKFEKEVFDLGTIKEGDKVEQVVLYTNTGKNPLIIFTAFGSCGCTIPTYNKEPLAPGETDTLRFTFNASGKHGSLTKSVSVFANTQPPTNTFKFTVKVK
jgi:hypothetical protein